ncbi:MAG: tetratricopeptide repeat protein, partial [Candidatus Kapaibacteriota bacterium]
MLVITSLLIILLFTTCSTEKKVIDNLSFNTNIYDLYLQANNLDSNTVNYIKSKYLIDLLISAKENEKLENHYEAIADLLEALRYDTSKVILFAIAKNFYYVKRYTLAFDYAYQSFLLDTNFIPTIDLLARVLYVNRKFDLAKRFAQKLLTLRGQKLSVDDIDLNLVILEALDTSCVECINFLKSLNNPKLDFDVKYRLAYYYSLRNDTSEVLKILEYFLDNPIYFQKLDYSHLKYYFEGLLNLGEYEKARNRFRQFSNKFSISDALLIINIFIERIDTTNLPYKQFVQDFAIMLDSLHPNNYQYELKQLEIFIKTKDTANTYKLCKKILSKENIDLETLIKTAFILFSDLNKKSEAIKYYQSFKLIFSEEPNYYNYLGFFYLNNKQYHLAEEAYIRAISLDSTDYSSYAELGYLYAELEDWSKSDTFYLKSLEIYPDNPVVLNNFAYSLIQRDTNLSYASMLVERALKMQPDDPNF